MSKSKISYLCNRCKHGAFDLDAECLVCDRGSRFVEVKRGPDVAYNMYSKVDISTTKDLVNMLKRSFEIKRVVFSEPATIVMWADGTKTVVKCQEGDVFDPEKGLAMAIAKKALGNKGNFNDVFKKWLPEEKEEKSRTIIGKVAHFDKTEDGIYATIEANCNIDGYKLFKTLQESEAREMSISFDVKEKK